MIAEDQILDGYRLIRRIGTGGFGDVWLCEPQVMPGVRKALKWVPGAILPKLERELAALIQYQQVSQKLRQANLVPIEHINRTAEGLFYVMPLADGLHATMPNDPAWRSASLLGLIESHRKAKTWFSSQEIIHLMMPVLDALQQLSDIGIVHRDVKPENILLINGLPFLADISLLGEDTIDMTHRGTPGFVAPSWYLESGGHPDQYSAAATLYCLLTGNSPDKMGRSAFRWPPGGEQTLNPNERKEWLRFHRVVYRGTHDQNSERFRDFSAMGRALEAQQSIQKNSRNKALLSLAVGTILLVVSYVVWPQTPASTVNIGGSIPPSVFTETHPSPPKPSANSQPIPMQEPVAVEDLFKEGMDAYTGGGLISDLATAARCFDKAAKAGHAPAQVMCGLMKLEPEMFDSDQAWHWFQVAAKQGNPAGQYNLGCCLFWGLGVQKDEKEAIGWFLKAADQGFAVAEYAFGYSLLTDVSTQVDARQGIPWLLKAAQNSLPEAMYLLGVLAETGDIIPRDEKAALNWQKLAAEKHYNTPSKKDPYYYNPPPYIKLAAWCDVYGNPSLRAYNRFMSLRRNASIPKDIFNLNRLNPIRIVSNGKVMFKIQGVVLGDPDSYAEDIPKAVERIAQCSLLRNADAELWWGKNLVNGMYFEKNPKLALPWLRRAAAQGHPDAKKWMVTAIQNLNATANK